MPKGRKAVLLLVDSETGETISETGTFITDRQREQSRRFFEQQREQEIEEWRINAAYDEQGHYCWLLYSIGESLLPQLENSELFRLMFISTYLGYEGYLVFDNSRPMSKAQLAEQLGLSKSEFERTWVTFLEYRLLWECEGKIYLKPDIFHRGALTSRMGKEIQENVIRIYHDGTRALYNCVGSRGHKLAGAVYRLIPYINRYYHIVCYNPWENILEQIHPMSWKEVCLLLGYSTDRPNHLKKRMLKIVDSEGYKEILFDEEVERIFVSPRLFYAGNRMSDIYQLADFTLREILE